MRFHGCSPRVCLLALFLFTSILAARGATLTVTNLNDTGAGSLRAAIASAASGDTIAFASGLTGTLTLTSGQLTVAKTLTITGPGADKLTIDGKKASRHFYVSGSLILSGLTLANGSGPGGAGGSVCNAKHTELQQCVFTNNTAPNSDDTAYGGAVFNVGTLLVTGCTFTGNIATGVNGAFGGAIYHQAGNVTVNTSTFSRNKAEATKYDYDDSGESSGFAVSASGGAIYQNTAHGSLTVVDSTFDSNYASAYASGDSSTFNSYMASAFAHGGAITNDAGTVTIRSSLFVSNSATSDASADDTANSNSQGGGFDNAASGSYTVLLTNCTFTLNDVAASSDGGYDSYGGYPEGGGIESKGHLTLLACTLVGNTADFGGGLDAQDVEVGNTIIAQNTGSDVPYSAGITSDGYNFIGVNYATGFTAAGDQVGTASKPLDPILRPLEDNAGPTRTMMPRPASPLLDKGKAFGLTTDARGSFRTADFPNITNAAGGDGTDIGAAELASNRVKGDFDNDDYADLVFQNTTTGQRSIWYLKNGVYQSTLALPTMSTDWQIATTGDFNRDGYSDLVWQNTKTGERMIWLMKKGVHLSTLELPSAGTQWSIAGAADFDEDGNVDLVWQNTKSGERLVWLLVNGVYQSRFNLPTVDTAWQIAGAEDINADGSADLVWQKPSTGEHLIWLMKKGIYQKTINLQPEDKAWQIAGVVDINDDGYADLVWQNTSTSQRTIWLLKNGVYQKGLTLPTVDKAWQIADH